MFLTIAGSVSAGCVFSDEDATRFNASINGFRVFVSVGIAAGVDDLVVRAGRPVDGILGARRWERLDVPFLVADLVRYRLCVAVEGGCCGPPASRAVSSGPSGMLPRMTQSCVSLPRG